MEKILLLLAVSGSLFFAMQMAYKGVKGVAVFASTVVEKRTRVKTATLSVTQSDLRWAGFDSPTYVRRGIEIGKKPLVVPPAVVMQVDPPKKRTRKSKKQFSEAPNLACDGLKKLPPEMLFEVVA